MDRRPASRVIEEVVATLLANGATAEAELVVEAVEALYLPPALAEAEARIATASAERAELLRRQAERSR